MGSNNSKITCDTSELQRCRKELKALGEQDMKELNKLLEDYRFKLNSLYSEDYKKKNSFVNKYVEEYNQLYEFAKNNAYLCHCINISPQEVEELKQLFSLYKQNKDKTDNGYEKMLESHIDSLIRKSTETKTSEIVENFPFQSKILSDEINKLEKPEITVSNDANRESYRKFKRERFIFGYIRNKILSFLFVLLIIVIVIVVIVALVRKSPRG